MNKAIDMFNNFFLGKCFFWGMDIDQCIALTTDWYKREKNKNVYNICV